VRCAKSTAERATDTASRPVHQTVATHISPPTGSPERVLDGVEVLARARDDDVPDADGTRP
jgi:hypothetical protein